ncbi:MAG: hypothetical protein ACRECN_06460 [Methylocella sp.]
MTRKLPVTEARKLRQFSRILPRKKAGAASSNGPHVASHVLGETFPCMRPDRRAILFIVRRLAAPELAEGKGI